MEGVFAKLTRRRLKHAIFNSVAECEAAIGRFIEEHSRKKERVPGVGFTPLVASTNETETRKKYRGGAND